MTFVAGAKRRTIAAYTVAGGGAGGAGGVVWCGADTRIFQDTHTHTHTRTHSIPITVSTITPTSSLVHVSSLFFCFHVLTHWVHSPRI